MKENTQEHTNYFRQRLGEIGVPIDDARLHGLRLDPNGNILQFVRGFDGNNIEYTPKDLLHKINSKGKSTKKGKDQLREVPLVITRLHPAEHKRRQEIEDKKAVANGKEPKKIGKYKFPAKYATGLEVLPMPSNSAIKAYNDDKIGGLAVGIEGYFKAAALSVNSIEAIAFSGITTYKVCDQLRDYLLKRELKTFVIMYDGDALDLSDNQGEVINSKRVFDFYNSARRFSSQFYNFCKANGLKTKLHFSMVNKDLPFKGVDDLLYGMQEQKEEILEELRNLKTGKYFTFLSLNSRNNEKRLKSFFGLSTHVQFYNNHKSIIQDKPFLFAGFKYQAEKTKYHYDGKIKVTGVFGNETYFNTKVGTKYSHSFKALFNPFHVEIEEEVLEVEKYLSEVNNELSTLINNNDRLSLDAITGIGKTAFFLGHFQGKKYVKGFFNKSNQHGVICVPTISLVKQLSKKYAKHGAVGIHGFVSSKTQLKAINTKIIICTYDTLHHVSDLWRRILVVDESHNLVNQWGEVSKNRRFRASILNKVVESFDTAKKVVLISGTPSKLLAKKLDFKYTRIERKENNIINVRAIESEANSYLSLTTSTLAELEKIDFKEDKIHFVYYNSKKHLERIKTHLVDNGVLSPDCIEIVDRDNVDVANDRIYNQVITKEQIEGVKLVLCTCLISEGVNINNENIGNVYTVGIYCMDSFRQFVARFRKMETLQVFDIKRPEKWINKGFGNSCMLEYDYLIGMAELQMKYQSLSAHNDLSGDYIYTIDGLEEEEQIVPYIQDIEASVYDYQSGLMNFTYTDDEGIKIDKLKIFAKIKERETTYCNNAYFYTQINKFKNIHLEGLEEEQPKRLDDINSELKDLAKDEKKAKDIIICNLKNDLIDTGTIVVHAYLIAAKDSKNRHAIKKILNRANDLIIEEEKLEAKEYFLKYKASFKNDWFVKIINAYIKLRFIEVEEKVLVNSIRCYSERDFNKEWRKIKTLWEFSIYEKKHLRKYLNRTHKIDVKANVRLKETIDRFLLNNEGEVIKSTDLYVVIRDYFSSKVPKLDKKGESNTKRIVVLSDYKIDSILHELYNVDIKLMAEYKEFVLEEVKPLFEHQKPNIEKAYIDAFLYEKRHTCNRAVLTQKMASTG